MGSSERTRIPRHAENEPHGRDLTRPIYNKSASLERPLPVSPGPWVPQSPPADAIILFSGDLSQWQHEDGSPAQWTIGNGYIEIAPDTGDIYTKQNFGDCEVHVEFASPVVVKETGQARGNSGVIFMNKYEVQILDNYDNETYPLGYASGIYGQAVPLVNASRPPGEWQELDITFRRPRFGNGDEVLEPATMTVVHNRILVIDKFPLTGPTGQYDEPYTRHPDALPLSLQDHGDLVRFRDGGTWIRPLE